MGFRLPPNFDAPYKARNISEFWKRWHMSLTTWFRDYLFLPFAYGLSGKMQKPKYAGIKTEVLIYISGILITFILCGLWHGPAMNFLLWGTLQGFALGVHKLLYPKTRLKKNISSFRLFLSQFFTFHFIVFSWIIFRIPGTEAFTILFRKLFFQFHADLAGQVILAYWKDVALLVAGFLLIWAPIKLKDSVRSTFVSTPEYVKILALVCVIFVLYQFKTSGIQPFIYFQF
jgi:alginate O-acetyltransferase complex protein AlgI